MKFDESRTFGVEIEFTMPGTISTITNDAGRLKIVEALNNANILTSNESYNHEVRPCWKLIHDSSCGLELVSPPLKGMQGLQDVREVCRVLHSVGAIITPQCGLHVHIGVGELRFEQIRDVVIFYAKYEEEIDQLVEANRRGNANYYCKSILCQTTMDQIKQTMSVEGLKNRLGARYRKVNIESYARYGTVEFRQHHGTLNADDIEAWIIFVQAIVYRVKTGKVTTSVQSRGIKQMFKALQYVGPHQFVVEDELSRNMMKRLNARSRQVGFA